MDEKGVISASSSYENLGSPAITGSNFLKLPSDSWNFCQLNGENVSINYKKLEQSGWYIVSVIPYKDIVSTGVNLRNQMLLFMLIIAAVAYFIAYLVSKSSVKRISLLSGKMKEVQQGDFNVTIARSGSDEIGDLMESFNEMVSKMTILLDDKYRMGQELKSSELKALQAQINPHFLYNSLDLINCIAIKHNIPDIIAMVNALAKFYKLSLSRGNNIIPIKDEVSHALVYVQIQNMRFDNRIKLEMSIDEEIYNYYTVKIILQPIIENSILHGIFEKDSKSGTIKISGRLEADNIIFTIEDDGIGMTEETINQVLSPEKAISKGYGIKNINDRIQLAFGEKYGLTYSSILGAGTRVVITLPAVSTLQ